MNLRSRRQRYVLNGKTRILGFATPDTFLIAEDVVGYECPRAVYPIVLDPPRKMPSIPSPYSAFGGRKQCIVAEVRDLPFTGDSVFSLVETGLCTGLLPSPC